jgi:hypothetical protein
MQTNTVEEEAKPLATSLLWTREKEREKGPAWSSDNWRRTASVEEPRSLSDTSVRGGAPPCFFSNVASDTA